MDLTSPNNLLLLTTISVEKLSMLWILTKKQTKIWLRSNKAMVNSSIFISLELYLDKQMPI